MWIPFLAELEALQGIFNYIIGLPDELLGLGLGVLWVFLYPFAMISYYAVIDVNYLWLIIASVINAMIGIPNTIIALKEVVLPAELPPALLVLVMAQIMIQVYIRFFAWLVWLYKKIPVVGGH